jgi:hypothetical protein
VAKLKRKNLVVDDEKIKELARLNGTSESEAVRQAVDYALAAKEVIEALTKLSERGGVDDVFGRLPDEIEAEAAALWDAQTSSTRAS